MEDNNKFENNKKILKEEVQTERRNRRKNKGKKRGRRLKLFFLAVLEGAIYGAVLLAIFLSTFMVWQDGMARWSHDLENECALMATRAWVNGFSGTTYVDLKLESANELDLTELANRGLRTFAMEMAEKKEDNLKFSITSGQMSMSYESRNPMVFSFTNNGEIYDKYMMVIFDESSYHIEYRVEMISLVLMCLGVLVIGFAAYYFIYRIVKKIFNYGGKINEQEERN